MNVLIVEDHPIMAMGTKMLIQDNFETSLVDVAKDGKETIIKVKNNLYDLIILDIGLPHTDSHRLLQNIKKIQPDTKVLVYSQNQDEIYALPYIKLGANGYLNKSNSDDSLILVIKSVLAGQLVINQKVMQGQLNNPKHFDFSTALNSLSEREVEVIRHLIKGDRLKEIAETMNIAQSTVSTLKTRILKKTGIKNVLELSKIYGEFESYNSLKK